MVMELFLCGTFDELVYRHSKGVFKSDKSEEKGKDKLALLVFCT